jgi:predicted pyridoxine 5'-phosphate oxidase superfamily flavin-nucleotide-binding protein
MSVAWDYHDGERAVQARAGVQVQAERNGRGIRRSIPDIAAEFLAERRFVVAGSIGDDGRVWCSLLVGGPGFLTAADEHTLVVEAVPSPTDPLGSVAVGDQIGLLAIEPATRRRMRVNGVVREIRPDAFVVAADEVISNCPRHITRRPIDAVVTANGGSPHRPVQVADHLSTEQAWHLVTADTFFLATTAPDGGGVDASHRGGEPGFVTVVDDRHLSWPDFNGNAMFMTLGNLELDPRAGLLVVDWDTGATLQLTGHASVQWRSPDDRTMAFTIEQVRATSPVNLSH